MAEVGKILSVQIAETVVRKNREVKKWCAIEEGTVVIVRMILSKSKGGTRSWKLAEVEETIFSEDYRGGCMHK